MALSGTDQSMGVLADRLGNVYIAGHSSSGIDGSLAFVAKYDKPAVATLPLVSCCSTGTTTDLHGKLADLLARYNVNDYAASVKVYAVKPG